MFPHTDLVEKYGSIAAAAASVGMARTTFRDRYHTEVKQGSRGTKPVLDGFEITQTSAQLDAGGGVEREWVKQRPAHGDAFEIPDGHSVAGVSALVGADGRTIQKWVKTKAEPTTEDIAEIIAARLADHEGASRFVSPPKWSDDDLLTVYPCADYHIGMLSWHRETGHSYDMDIAKETITRATGQIVAASPNSSRAIVLGLGDLMHTDNYENRTNRSGAALDVDGRYPRVLDGAVDQMIATIDLALAKHGTVDVRILPGNHDERSAIAVSLGLGMFYRNNPRVTVDRDPSRFWYYEFGSVMLAATHTDMAKLTDMPSIMAQRMPEMWGRTRFRHAYGGHVHHINQKEIGGVIVESFQTPAPADQWHHASGYGAGRSLVSITHHRKHGEIGRCKVNIY